MKTSAEIQAETYTVLAARDADKAAQYRREYESRMPPFMVNERFYESPADYNQHITEVWDGLTALGYVVEEDRTTVAGTGGQQVAWRYPIQTSQGEMGVPFLRVGAEPGYPVDQNTPPLTITQLEIRLIHAQRKAQIDQAVEQRIVAEAEYREQLAREAAEAFEESPQARIEKLERRIAELEKL